MSEKKKGRGRPATKYDEQEIYAIVNHYRKNVQPQGDIKYLQLYHYHLELHKGHPEICSRTYSEDFWRKKGQPGRTAIDNTNKIRTVSLVNANNNKKDIPNVVGVVSQYKDDPDRLIKHLQPLENEVRRSIQNEIDLKQKNEDLKQQIKQEKEDKRKLKEQIERLEECIFKLFHYSEMDGIPLENLLDMNNKNKRIKRALDEAFSKPQDFYTEFENFQHKITKDVVSKDNILSLTDAKIKPQRTLADDFKGKF